MKNFTVDSSNGPVIVGDKVRYQSDRYGEVSATIIRMHQRIGRRPTITLSFKIPNKYNISVAIMDFGKLEKMDV